MVTHTPKHLRFWTCILIPVYLTAMILPTNSAKAVIQAKNCDNTSVQSAALAAVAVPDATQQVVIPKVVLDRAFFQANWRARYKDFEAVAAIIQGEILLNMASVPDGDKLLNLMQDWQGRYEKAIVQAEATDRTLIPYEALIFAALDEALKTPEMAIAVPTVWAKITDKSYLSQSALTDSARIAMSGQRYDLGARMLALAPQFVNDIYDCAHKNSAIAQVFDALNHRKLNAAISASAEEILGNNPDLSVPEEIRGRINADGTISFSLDELKGLTAAEFEKINESILDMQNTLAKIDKDQRIIVDYINDQKAKAEAQKVAQAKAAEHKLKVDAAKASVTILSTLYGFIDPKVGKQVETVGTATIQVAEAINDWLKAASGLKVLDKVLSLSSVVATGSILSAAMSIVGLFGDEKPNLDKIILEEIGKLRQQVDKLRVEMNERFDRIDEGLNTIYNTMNERFNQIDIQLGILNGNVRDVQQSLVDLDVKLSRIERNNFELINDVGRRPLVEAISSSLGYLQRTGLPMAYEPDFVDFEGKLLAWGTATAYDSGNVGPSQRDYSDQGVLTELNAYPLDANLNYLNSWVIAHGVPPLSDRPLASPRDWLFASRAYTQLGLEWPEHMSRVNADDQARIDQVGFELEQAMEKISGTSTPTGTIGNTLLYSTVITYYDNKLDALDAAIRSVETKFVEQKRDLDWRGDEVINLFGGTDQPLTYLPPELTTITCDNANVPAPSNLKSLIPSFNLYNLAEYLNLGKLNVCVHYELGAETELCHIEQEPPFSEVCDIYNGANAVLNVLFDNVSIMTLTAIGGFGYLSPEWTRRFSQLTPEWTENENFKARLEGLTAPDVPSPEVAAQRAEFLKTIIDRVEATLAFYQQSMYNRVLQEFTGGSIKGQAVEAAGATALLGAFTTLGMPRAVNSDEFLHAMLYGNQRLVDDGLYMQTYAISKTQPITGTGLLVNPRLVVKQVADKRIAVFGDMIRQYLNAMSANTYAEAPDYIASTRRALDLTMRIVKLNLPVAIAGLQASSNAPTVLGNPTTFAATAGQGTNISFAWDFGDGSTDSGAAPSHTYTQAGSYLVRVTASNSINQSTVDLVVQVHALDPAAAPIAGLTATRAGPTVAGEPMSFTATVSAGSNVIYAWDFGDGKVGIGANLTHIFAEPGAYQVRLLASNSISQATAEIQVVVKPSSTGQATSQTYLPALDR